MYITCMCMYKYKCVCVCQVVVMMAATQHRVLSVCVGGGGRSGGGDDGSYTTHRVLSVYALQSM